MTFLICFTLFSTFFQPNLGNSTEVQTSYQEGIHAYQKEDFESSAQHFLNSVKASPYNKYALYNWGLARLQLGDMEKATAAWRRALSVDPNFLPAEKGIEYLASRFAGALPLDTDSSWEQFRNQVLLRFSLSQMLSLSLLLLLISGTLMIRYFGKRRQALLKETPLPPTPTVGMSLTVFLFLSLALVACKGWDLLTPRATVTADSLPLRSGPSVQDSSLMDVMGGSELIVNRRLQDWVQVTYPGGLTGWVPQKDLFHTSGRAPW